MKIILTLILFLFANSMGLSQNLSVIDSLKALTEKPTDSEKAILFYKIGCHYNDSNKYDMAITYFEKSLKIYKNKNNEIQQANILNKIGNAYLHTDDYDRALDNYIKSLE
ncbi:MAG: tetratricopeptide repeat protein, partial [Bacteroidota bacterium]